MRFCGMCGAPLAVAPARRERRRVTTVFIDLTGFSTLTRDFDPEKLRDLADDVLSVVAGIIEEYDGYIDAFQGDGLIALFGAPHAHPNDPERAVLAAAEGLRAIEAMGRSKGYPLKGRAGVNTGLVIAGNLGSGKIKDYTVMGSAVNLAARLEAAATPGEVWVGPETYRATQHSLRYEPSPVLTLAGFPDITQAQRFMHEARQRDPYAQLKFVGRDAEMIALWGALERAKAQRTAQELWVVGEAGSGKTRLVREFSEAVAAQGVTRVVWLEPGPIGAAKAYSPGQPGAQGLADLQTVATDKPLLLISDGPRQAASPPTGASATPFLHLRLARKSAPTGAAQLALAPLSKDACLSILEELVDPSLRLVTTSLVGETGGNPAYTIELGRTLSNARTGSFSGSLTSLLQARLDMLPLAQRYLLAQLALVGERSWAGLATHLTARLTDVRGADVEALLSEELLVRELYSSLPGETELRFRSELLRRAALLTVPLSERPSLHGRIAEWLAPRVSAELASLLEHHRRESRADTPVSTLLGSTLSGDG